MKKNLKDFAIKLKDFAKKTQGFSKKTQGFVRKLNASEATSLIRPPKKRSINKPALWLVKAVRTSSDANQVKFHIFLHQG